LDGIVLIDDVRRVSAGDRQKQFCLQIIPGHRDGADSVAGLSIVELRDDVVYNRAIGPAPEMPEDDFGGWRWLLGYS
jgi:hypothetical protein